MKPKPIPCPNCFRRFYNTPALQTHLRFNSCIRRGKHTLPEGILRFELSLREAENYGSGKRRTVYSKRLKGDAKEIIEALKLIQSRFGKVKL